MNRAVSLTPIADRFEVQLVTTPSDWQQRRAEIVRGIQRVMGRLPSDERRVPVNVKVEEEADAKNYIRQLITYQAEPESRTPAYLCIPKTVLVSSCGFDSFLDYYDGAVPNWYFGKGWCQIRYMPRLSSYRAKLRGSWNHGPT